MSFDYDFFIPSKKRALESFREALKREEHLTALNPQHSHLLNLAAVVNFSFLLGEYHIALQRWKDAYFWLSEARQAHKDYFNTFLLYERKEATVVKQIAFLSVSVLLKDSKELAESATLVRNLPPGWEQEDLFSWYSTLLCAIILDDSEQESASFVEFEKHSKHWRAHHFENGLDDTFAGLLEKDKARLQKGLKRMLRSFSNRKRKPSSHVCLVAAVAIILAQNKGIDISVERDIPSKFHQVLPLGIISNDWPEKYIA